MKHKIFTFKRQLLLAIFICTGILVSAQVEKSIHVSTTGTLSSLLTENEKSVVTKLVVTTSEGVALNEEDFSVLNGMTQLKELDLSGDANTQNFPGNAFSGNKTIESIKFPSRTSGFGGGAFNGCALKGIVSFPSTITNPANFTSRFDNCQGITGFDFPDNDSNHALKAIDGVIVGWGNTLMKYPCGKIGDTYSIPSGIVTIAQQAFGDNHQLKKLIFPASVTTFNNEGATFRNTDSLEEIEVDPANPTYGSTSGILLNKTSKSLIYFPPASKTERLVIDGSQAEKMTNGFFANAYNVKQVIFTEGFKEIGYTAFKQGGTNPLPLEYVELPASIAVINGEAFNTCKNLLQIICKATTPPAMAGRQTFRDANGNAVRLGVPAESIEAYQNSAWNRTLDGTPEGSTFTYADINCFSPEQIVAYYDISYEGAVAGLQNVSVPGFQVRITAGEPPVEGQAFSGWRSEPAGIAFTNPSAVTTYFTMPSGNVKIIATFSAQNPYTIIGATASQSGTAAVGSSVNLETAAQKIVDDNVLYFRKWQINKGAENGLVISNPNAVATSFVVVEGEIEIEAVYQAAYMVNISGGSTPELEYFEGDVVTITASIPPNQTFVNWTTTTPGVVFADATATTTTFTMPASEVSIAATYEDTSTSINNPDNGKLTLVSYPGSVRLWGALNESYVIYNSLGYMVLKGITNGEDISVSALPEGLYFFKVADKTIRFIKN